MTKRARGERPDTVDDGLFVPLETKWYEEYESGRKDVELRGFDTDPINNAYLGQFTPKKVYPGRPVRLCRGYRPENGILRGEVGDVRSSTSLNVLADRFDFTRIVPDAEDRVDFLVVAEETLSDWDRYIAFEVILDG